jgi:hypothetical protein
MIMVLLLAATEGGKGTLTWVAREGGAAAAPNLVVLDKRVQVCGSSLSWLLRSFVVVKPIVHAQVCLGKQTNAFKSGAAAAAHPNRCLSVLVSKTELNLEAETEEQRTMWLTGFHALMTKAGKKPVFEE